MQIKILDDGRVELRLGARSAAVFGPFDPGALEAWRAEYIEAYQINNVLAAALEAFRSGALGSYEGAIARLKTLLPELRASADLLVGICMRLQSFAESETAAQLFAAWSSTRSPSELAEAVWQLLEKLRLAAASGARKAAAPIVAPPSENGRPAAEEVPHA